LEIFSTPSPVCVDVTCFATSARTTIPIHFPILRDGRQSTQSMLRRRTQRLVGDGSRSVPSCCEPSRRESSRPSATPFDNAFSVQITARNSKLQTRKRRCRAPRQQCPAPTRALRLSCGSAAALASGRLLLRGRPALRRVAAPGAGAGRLAAAARRSRRVRDSRRALLRHPLLLQLLVLLLVLDARSLVRHRYLLPNVPILGRV